ncbi:toxin-antitoxin system YwqK family antitoxin [Aquimarina sp. I32.4]|uniref:toxin-antitoxin system YwqK family antitoxin n=1 Tax=Aquimarina sp. I32.4 TaxID=2053903 RepID=UPI000CDEA9B2|nr:hypothetical protein [Aquimarina sp. I32.4]
MSIKKLLPLLTLIYLCNSCKTELTKITEKFEDGTTKGYYYIDKDSLKQGARVIYYKNGKIFSTTSYKNNVRNDSIYFYYDNKDNSIEIIEFWYDDKSLYYKDFYENKNVRQKGIYNKEDKRIGIWNNYNEDGTPSFIKEYKIINAKSYTNQLWQLLSNGDTLNTGTSMKYKIAPRKVKLGDSIRFFFQPDVAQHPNESDFIVTIPKDYTQKNFNADFSNTEEKYYKPYKYSQKIYSLKYNNTYPAEKEKIDTADHYKTVLFYLTPKRVGKDTIRGYFDEMYSMSKGLPNLWWRYTKKELEAMGVEKDSTKDTDIRTIYFDIPIEVYK